MKKLPTINWQYWLLVVAATTLGETAGDLISQTLGLGYGGGTLAILGAFFVAMLISVAARKQHALTYWLVILLASIGGTTLSDWISRTLEFGYLWSTVLIASVLAAVLIAWKLSARTLDLTASFSRRSEILYWLAILSSSTLGTAFGDLISNGTPLGFGGGTLVLLALLAVVIALVFLTKTPRAICYWLAIVITHPLGATMGDYMTKPEGFNLGNIWASVILVAVLFVVATSLFVMHRGNRSYESTV